MAPPDPFLGFPTPGAHHGHDEQHSAVVSPRRNKRKTTAGVSDDSHRLETDTEAEAHRTAARRRISSSATAEEGIPLPHPAGQFVEQTEGGSGFLYDNEQRNYHQQQPAAVAENGGTAAQPIVIDDGYDEVEVIFAPAAAERDGGGSPCPEPEPEQPVVMPLPACGEKKERRYELLSAYLTPPLPDADEEDALRWPAAGTVPRYFSPVDVFFGTENGVWMY